MNLEFGKNIRSIRENRGLSLEEMAEILETTKQALSRYERGERTPKITLAAKFAEKLNVPLEDLIGADDEKAKMKKEESSNEPSIHHPEIRLLASKLDRLPQEQRDQALDVFNAMYHKFFDQMEDEKK